MTPSVKEKKTTCTNDVMNPKSVCQPDSDLKIEGLQIVH